MIGYLRGRVIEKSVHELWLDVRDVGYRVRVIQPVLQQFLVGDEAELYIHTHVREDALELYGFSERRQLSLYEMIISVSGVGPKIGLAVLSSGSVERIQRAIREAEVNYFTLVPGIGKKGAQRLIVDLKGKLPSSKELDLSDDLPGEDAVVEALTSFGFSRVEVQAVIKDIDSELVEEERIREGFKRLGKR
jgi:holliday junction DNA helicase RuvA